MVVGQSGLVKPAYLLNLSSTIYFSFKTRFNQEAKKLMSYLKKGFKYSPHITRAYVLEDLLTKFVAPDGKFRGVYVRKLSSLSCFKQVGKKKNQIK